MKETLIVSLNNHNIYYMEEFDVSFYIAIPKNKPETNITIEFNPNINMYDLKVNNLSVVTEKISNYYQKLDNYNISLVLPIFNDDILNKVRTIDDEIMFQKLDKLVGNLINLTYNSLAKNNIKVNDKVIIINNDSHKNFLNWFLKRYPDRIEYRTMLELMQVTTNEVSTYNKISTAGINFVVGSPVVDEKIKSEELVPKPPIDIVIPETPMLVPEKKAGYVSYLLLGFITIGISVLVLILLL